MPKQYKVLERSFINGKLCEAGAEVTLEIDSPGSNLQEIKTSTAASAPVAPPAGAGDAVAAYFAKHAGGGHWRIEDAQGERVGDFTGSKEEALAEAARMNAGDPDLDDQEGNGLPDA